MVDREVSADLPVVARKPSRTAWTVRCRGRFLGRRTVECWCRCSGVRPAERGLHPGPRAARRADLSEANLGVPGRVETIAQATHLTGFDQLRGPLAAELARMVGRPEGDPRARNHEEDRPDTCWDAQARRRRSPHIEQPSSAAPYPQPLCALPPVRPGPRKGVWSGPVQQPVGEAAHAQQMLTASHVPVHRHAELTKRWLVGRGLLVGVV